jgi:hypothetical protein
MKGLTQELKDMTIKKWEGIAEKVKNAEKLNYISTYWTSGEKSCGFCIASRKVHDRIVCGLCYLNTNIIGDVRVCYSTGNNSVLKIALGNAENKNFGLALDAINAALEVMRAAPVEEEKDEYSEIKYGQVWSSNLWSRDIVLVRGDGDTFTMIPDDPTIRCGEASMTRNRVAQSLKEENAHLTNRRMVFVEKNKE